VPDFTVIAMTEQCPALDRYSMTFGEQHNKLSVAFLSGIRDAWHRLLASPGYDGKSWAKPIAPGELLGSAS